MKKLMLLVTIFFAIVFCYNQKPVPVATANNIIQAQPDEIIRFHVVANSDTAIDQAIKRKVRDEVVMAMTPVFKNANSIETATSLAEQNLAEIESIANKTIKAMGYNHKATAKLGEYPFPTKTYGNFSLPAGTYKAVRIQIGEGKGQNWWCVLFPPLCFVDLTHSLAANPAMVPINQPQASPTELQNYDELDVEHGKVEIRFATIEFLKKFF